MTQLRKASERGRGDHSWLKTFHTFSFADYDDPRHRHFRHLRVLNEDVIAPGQGFGMHPHQDMEIVTYVLSGALAHEDSMGNTSVIRPGEVQRMSAGTGVRHSEFNASVEESVHLLQIWILPQTRGLPPGYEQKSYPEAARLNRFILAASPEGGDAVKIHQDARLYLAVLEKGKSLSHNPAEGRHAWIQTARGRIRVGSYELNAGDGAAASGETHLEIQALEDSEILLFDLA